MRRYATSKMRILFLATIAIVLIITVPAAFAQAPAATQTTTAVRSTKGAFGLVLDNLDFVFVTIFLLSIYGVALIIQGAIKNRRDVLMPESSTNRIRELINANDFQELLNFTEADGTFVSNAVNASLRRAPNFQQMKEAMETSVAEQTANQFRSIEHLNIIGNLGPLLGLLGTVLGMIEAFQAMNAAGGQANPADLAGGISKALAHTMLGLILAVPCLAAFGILRTNVDRLTTKAALVAEELLLMMRPSEPRAVAQARPVAQPAQSAARGPAPMPAPGIS
jgi:biopolymer transport protein ExbB